MWPSRHLGLFEDRQWGSAPHSHGPNHTEPPLEELLHSLLIDGGGSLAPRGGSAGGAFLLGFLTCAVLVFLFWWVGCRRRIRTGGGSQKVLQGFRKLPGSCSTSAGRPALPATARGLLPGQLPGQREPLLRQPAVRRLPLARRYRLKAVAGMGSERRRQRQAAETVAKMDPRELREVLGEVRKPHNHF